MGRMFGNSTSGTRKLIPQGLKVGHGNQMDKRGKSTGNCRDSNRHTTYMGLRVLPAGFSRERKRQMQSTSLLGLMRGAIPRSPNNEQPVHLVDPTKVASSQQQSRSLSPPSEYASQLILLILKILHDLNIQ